MLEKEDYLNHFNLEKLKLSNRSRALENELYENPHEFAKPITKNKT
jgi:hypothetical protein